MLGDNNNTEHYLKLYGTSCDQVILSYAMGKKKIDRGNNFKSNFSANCAMFYWWISDQSPLFGMTQLYATDLHNNLLFPIWQR